MLLTIQRVMIVWDFKSLPADSHCWVLRAQISCIRHLQGARGASSGSAASPDWRWSCMARSFAISPPEVSLPPTWWASQSLWGLPNNLHCHRLWMSSPLDICLCAHIVGSQIKRVKRTNEWAQAFGGREKKERKRKREREVCQSWR